jgi:hypothetical protein
MNPLRDQNYLALDLELNNKTMEPLHELFRLVLPEAFRHDGNQYGRLQYGSGAYEWFSFDFFTESYQSFENELNHNRELVKELENSYKQLKNSNE